METILPLLLELLGVIAVLWMLEANPRFKLRPLGYNQPRYEALTALGLFALVLTIAFFFWLRADAAASGILANRLQVTAIAALPFGLVLLQRRQPLRSAGWNPKLLRLALLVGLPLALLAVFVSGKFQVLLGGVTSELGLALLFLAGICLVEETIFRGYIQSRLVAWLGWWGGWLTTAGLFVLWQVPRWLAFPGDWLFNVLYVIAQALLVGWIVRKSGHALAPALYRMISEWLLFL